jgi:hypothetical protein
VRLINLAQERNVRYFNDVPALFLQAVTYAIRFGHDTTLTQLAEDSKFSRNLAQPEGTGTLLHLAAEHKSLMALYMLLDKGYDPNLLNRAGETVLHSVVNASIVDENTLHRLITREAAEVAD